MYYIVLYVRPTDGVKLKLIKPLQCVSVLDARDGGHSIYM